MRRKFIALLFIVVIIITGLVKGNDIVGFYPTSDYLRNCSIQSIKKSNNFSWETFKGEEGAEFFTQRLKDKLFGDTVDLNYIREFQVVSEGYIESFKNIDLSIPSVSFIAYRKVKDKYVVREYRTEIMYKFKFEGYHWLVDDIYFTRL